MEAGYRHSETICTASSDEFFLIQMSGLGTGGGIPWEIKSPPPSPSYLLKALPVYEGISGVKSLCLQDVY